MEDTVENKTKKSRMILDTLKENVTSLRDLLQDVNDERIEQSIYRAIILFVCSGIDAVVKQLIIDTLEPVIERDVGAQEQLRKFAQRAIKKEQEKDCGLLAELFTARNSRKVLIEKLKSELAVGSLQSTEQLLKVGSYFDIPSNSLVKRNENENLRMAFDTRNKIVHQMDVNFESNGIEYYIHDEEIIKISELIEIVTERFIDEIEAILCRDITDDYKPTWYIEGDSLVIE